MKRPKPVAVIRDLPSIQPSAELAVTAVGVKGAIMSRVPLLKTVLSM